jgi:adenylylsulfate kinase
MSDSTQIVWHEHTVTRDDREKLSGHAGCVVWFTGLSGCGKSTIANMVDRVLYQRSIRTFLLDGDNIRHGLNASPQILAANHSTEYATRFGLGFGSVDREENIRRIAAVAQLFCSAGIITLTAFVSPYRRDRDAARQLISAHGRSDDFVEVFVNTPLEICEQRDPKGLYKQARAGKLKNFTGIDDPYEAPQGAELELPGGEFSAEILASKVVDYLEIRGKIPART